MIKLAELINIINIYSTDAQWDYRIVKFAADSSELLAKSEDFDIKDEELYNQFEVFMSAYKELIDTLNVDVHNFNPESFEEAGQLIDTLKKRYERIISNPYLNINPEEGYGEDFDPGDFTQFLTQVADDAEKKLQAAAGDDVDISEVRAAQYAQEFNDNKNIDRGDQNITWTGDKVQQALEARKRWFENLMAIKKLNINDPRYQNYIASRRQTYKNIMSDPDRKSAYREKSAKRNEKFRKKIQKEYSDELYDIENALLPEARKQKDLKKIQKLEERATFLREHKTHKKLKEKATQIRTIKESGSLDGLLTHLQQRIATQKIVVKQSITDKMRTNRDPLFAPYIEAIEKARLEKNDAALAAATKSLNKAMGDYAEKQPEVKVYVDHSLKFKEFKDKVKQISKTGWLDQGLPPEAIAAVQGIIEEGQNLADQYREVKFFNTVVKTTEEIVQYLRGKI